MRLLLGLLLASVAWSQSGRTVTLTWDDLNNPPGTLYVVYRAPGACSGTPTYAQIAAGVTLKTYDDTGLLPGKYCYAVAATYGGEESDKSVPSMAQVKPREPTNLRNVLSQILAWLGIGQSDGPVRVRVD